MGSLRPTPFSQIKDLTFRVYTEEEIDKISVVNITNETAFNDLGHHLEKGIYDPHMGVYWYYVLFTLSTCHHHNNNWHFFP